MRLLGLGQVDYEALCCVCDVILAGARGSTYRACARFWFIAVSYEQVHIKVEVTQAL
jgi:hypothetical protein